jgi:hypothetical protein
VSGFDAMTDAEKLAFVKERAAAEPWTSAIASVIQDMELIGHPMPMPLQELFMGEAVIGGERGVRRFIDWLALPAARTEVAQ